jgi:hypothetical protein
LVDVSALVYSNIELEIRVLARGPVFDVYQLFPAYVAVFSGNNGNLVAEDERGFCSGDSFQFLGDFSYETGTQPYFGGGRGGRGRCERHPFYYTKGKPGVPWFPYKAPGHGYYAGHF